MIKSIILGSVIFLGLTASIYFGMGGGIIASDKAPAEAQERARTSQGSNTATISFTVSGTPVYDED